VLQFANLDRIAPARLQQWFASAVAAHRWNGLFVVGDAAVLVSAERHPALTRPFAQWSAAARWLAHSAHLGDAADVERALLGTLRRPDQPVASTAAGNGRAAVLPVLHAWLAPTGCEAAAGERSVLMSWSAQQAELRRQVAAIRGLDDSAAGRAQAQAIALRFLPRGAGHAVLQAALGLPGLDGEPVLSPAIASRRAFALDPTFFEALPAVCGGLPTVQQTRGDLEDLAQLPLPTRLAALCCEDSPFAVALRARFPSPCARALVAQLAIGPLLPAAAGALRELADPFVLREAARAVEGRSGERELLGLWRHDLPAPDLLLALLQRTPADRLALAAAMRGRRGADCRLLLAGLLEAEELAVRSIAGELLRDTMDAAVPYDPQWSQSARHEAAERLRSLHNRAP
jgi:hypothetical protein